MSTPSEHSSLGPSSWSRWISCPGSVKASEGIPQVSRYEAAEGTVFHELMSDCLEFGLDPESFLGEGRGLQIGEYFIEYDQAMCAYARHGLEYVRSFSAEEGWETYIETRVDISDWTLPRQFGTSDVVMVNVPARQVIVFDWKYGHIPVYAEDNEQVQGYCLGAWKSIFGEKFGWDSEDISVRLVIEQPRVSGAGGFWDTTMEEVLVFGEKVKKRAALTQAKDAPVIPGEKQCKWCPAKNNCGARHEWKLQMLDLEFEDIDEAHLLAEPLVFPKPNSLSPERRSVILRNRSGITQWLSELHAQAVEDARLGLPTPGLKLVEGRRPNREFVEEHKHKAERLLQRHLGEKAWTERKLISPAKAEELLGKNRYARHLSGYVRQGQASQVLVPEEDNRTVIRSIMDEFEDIT